MKQLRAPSSLPADMLEQASFFNKLSRIRTAKRARVQENLVLACPRKNWRDADLSIQSRLDSSKPGFFDNF